MGRKRTGAKRGGRTGAGRFGLEGLETRQLMSMMVWGSVAPWGIAAGAGVRASAWVINGDRNPNNLNDAIVVAYNAGTQAFDLTMNGTLVQSRPASQVKSIRINGGKGDDTISVDTGGKMVPVSIYGGDGNDTITCGAENDYVDGGAGNDYIDGGAGNDTLYGGAGDDVVIGGLGKDLVSGGPGKDTLYGVKGTDIVVKDPSDVVIGMDKPADGTKPMAGQAPTANIDPALRQQLIDQAVAQWQCLLGTKTWNYRYVLPPYVTGRMEVLGVSSASSAGSSSSTDHSTTNDQVAGVDEADLVQTDGNYVYTLRGGQLLVIDVQDPKNATIVSSTAVNGWGSGLYLDGNRLVAVTSGGNQWTPRFIGFGAIAFNAWPSAQSTVQVFDVSNGANPTLMESTTLVGTTASSRMIGDQLYLVMNSNLQLPAPQVVQDDSLASGGNGISYRYQTEAEYRQWLAANIDASLPGYTTSLGDGTVVASGSLLGNIQYHPSAPVPTQMVTLLDFDIADGTPGPAAYVNAEGSATTVYASQQNLYVASYASGFPSSSTKILKFNMGTDSVAFDAAGQVNGSLLNSYAMDEYNGQLRVVTQQWATTDAQGITTFSPSATLYVLSDSAGQLTVTGELDGIGAGESVRSVLFDQDRAFVVTFKSVDPLFAIDLGDPANPVSAGELVLPGFSTYLFEVDHDHLIGVGSGQSTVNPVNFHTLQVSLFDVSDLANPKVVDQKMYDEGGQGMVTSAAQYDPHAFSYFAESGVLAIPSDGFSWNDGTSFNNLVVLQVDLAKGFKELGLVGSDTSVERSLRIGGNLYSLSTSDLKIVDLMNPSKVVADVNLPAAPPMGPIWALIIGPILPLPPVHVPWNPLVGLAKQFV